MILLNFSFVQDPKSIGFEEGIWEESSKKDDKIEKLELEDFKTSNSKSIGTLDNKKYGYSVSDFSINSEIKKIHKSFSANYDNRTGSMISSYSEIIQGRMKGEIRSGLISPVVSQSISSTFQAIEDRLINKFAKGKIPEIIQKELEKQSNQISGVNAGDELDNKLNIDKINKEQLLKDINYYSALSEGRGNDFFLNDKEKQRFQDSKEKIIPIFDVNNKDVLYYTAEGMKTGKSILTNQITALPIGSFAKGIFIANDATFNIATSTGVQEKPFGKATSEFVGAEIGSVMCGAGGILGVTFCGTLGSYLFGSAYDTPNALTYNGNSQEEIANKYGIPLHCVNKKYQINIDDLTISNWHSDLNKEKVIENIRKDREYNIKPSCERK
jgi:hypothetical protein